MNLCERNRVPYKTDRGPGNHFYDRLRQSMIQVQFRPSKPGIRQLVTDVLAVREAWIEVDRLENTAPTNSPRTSVYDPSSTDSQSGRAGWNG
jgi:hypothetical protein